MTKAVFNSTVKSLKKYDGIVDVVSELDEEEYSKELVGQMWLCESNGERFSVFDDELTFE